MDAESNQENLVPADKQVKEDAGDILNFFFSDETVGLSASWGLATAQAQAMAAGLNAARNQAIKNQASLPETTTITAEEINS